MIEQTTSGQTQQSTDLEEISLDRAQHLLQD